MILKYVIPAAALAMLAFAVSFVVRTYPVQSVADPPLPPPQSPFANALAAAGVVEACGGNIAVAAPAPGVIAEVFVRASQSVAAGAPLFRLDDRPLRAERQVRDARLAAARAQLARLEQLPRSDDVVVSAARVGEARANLAAQQGQLERGQELLKSHLVSPQEVERLKQSVAAAQEQLTRALAEDRQLRSGAWEADRAVARAAVGEAQALVDQANTELDRLTVRAPVAATVLQVNVRGGEGVGDRPGQAPVVLGTIRPLHLRVEIDEELIPGFRAGAPARALCRGQPQTTFSLRLVRVEPLVVPKLALTGDGGERTDTRVLPVVYEFDPGDAAVHVGQRLDVFIAAEPGPEPP